MDIAECKQTIADCKTLAETMSTLSIYFTDTARRLKLGEAVDHHGLAENRRIVREMLTTLRCAGYCEPLWVGPVCDDEVRSPSKNDGAAHIYTVGIMTHTARIQAPNPPAAVVFYGTLTHGNALFAAVVYAVDGEKYTGDTAPMMDVQLGKRELSAAELATIRKDLKDCEVVEWGGSLVEAPQ